VEECSYDGEDSATAAVFVENQRTAEWVQKIRGDEGSGLTLDRMRPPVKAADQTAGAGPGRFIPPAYLRRQGGAVVGTENSGAEKEQGPQKGESLVGQQANMPPPHEDDATSSTVSFESCESPRSATTTSLDSLLANSSGGGGSGVAGKRWPSVSRIPLMMAVGQSVSGDRDDRSKNMKNSRLLSLANSRDGAAPKGVGRYNSSVPHRGAVVTNSTEKNELADFSIAGGRLRVRSESPSR
jgi:hypothetical protein